MKKNFLLLDVRENDEVIAGKIEYENSMNTPRGIVDIIAAKGAMNTDQLIVIYCKKKVQEDCSLQNLCRSWGGLLTFIT